MRQVLGADDFARVHPVETDDASGCVFVHARLTDAAAERFQREMVEVGFGDGGTCNYEEQPGEPGECLLTVVDGEVVYSAGVNQNLGRTFRRGPSRTIRGSC
jgi:preprotein translocase subunit SecD